MYDITKPLDFNEKELIDTLTYDCIRYNVDERGMSWEGVARIFPDSWQWMKKRYEEGLA